jgi:hypothetical protein
MADSSLAALLGDDDLGRTALSLCQASLQQRSYDTYASTLSGFMQFCREQHVAPLAATPVHIARYVAWLGLHGTVAASSLQPYLSAINRFLRDHGAPPVALGPLVSDVRAGLGNSQVAVAPSVPRIPLPAPVALAILEHAARLSVTWTLPPSPSLLHFRAMLAVLVNYIYFCRGECGVSMRSGDISVHDGYITLFLAKVKGRSAKAAHQLPLLQIPATAIPMMAALLTKYIQGRLLLASTGRHPVPAALWALHPGESPASWTASTLSDWLAVSCSLVNHMPPPGFKWTSHSLRKGAASAANSINVVLTKIRYMGGWAKDSNVVHDYIDPTMAPSPAARVFFGHLLAPSDPLCVGSPVRPTGHPVMPLGPGKCCLPC